MRKTYIAKNTDIRVSKNHLPIQGRQAQSGVALFTVVMILILISIMGAISLGLSNMNNRISQNSQTSKLLTQSSYLPVGYLIKPKSTDELNRYMNTFGPLGYLTTSGNETSEYVFCYRPTEKAGVYESNNYMVLVGGGKVTKGTGYCNISSAKSFTSARKLAATQISILRPNQSISTNSADGAVAALNEVAVQPFEINNEGIDMSDFQEPVYYRAFSTSVLPTMAVADSDSDINACLQKTMADSALRKCLQGLDIPMNMQVQDFVYAPKITRKSSATASTTQP